MNTLHKILTIILTCFLIYCSHEKKQCTKKADSPNSKQKAVYKEKKTLDKSLHDEDNDNHDDNEGYEDEKYVEDSLYKEKLYKENIQNNEPKIKNLVPELYTNFDQLSRDFAQIRKKCVSSQKTYKYYGNGYYNIAVYDFETSLDLLMDTVKKNKNKTLYIVNFGAGKGDQSKDLIWYLYKNYYSDLKKFKAIHIINTNYEKGECEIFSKKLNNEMNIFIHFINEFDLHEKIDKKAKLLIEYAKKNDIYMDEDWYKKIDFAFSNLTWVHLHDPLKCLWNVKNMLNPNGGLFTCDGGPTFVNDKFCSIEQYLQYMNCLYILDKYCVTEFRFPFLIQRSSSEIDEFKASFTHDGKQETSKVYIAHREITNKIAKYKLSKIKKNDKDKKNKDFEIKISKLKYKKELNEESQSLKYYEAAMTDTKNSKNISDIKAILKKYSHLVIIKFCPSNGLRIIELVLKVKKYERYDDIKESNDFDNVDFLYELDVLYSCCKFQKNLIKCLSNKLADFLESKQVNQKDIPEIKNIDVYSFYKKLIQKNITKMINKTTINILSLKKKLSKI